MMSLAHIAGAVTAAKLQDRDRWLAEHGRPKSYFKRPKGNKAAFKTRKAVSAR
jgi:surface antigen